jgi:hypothetical protein
MVNAFLASSFVHVRAPLIFLEGAQRPTRQKTGKILENEDVLMADYGFRTRPIRLAGKPRERMNKDLAHLTYSRVRWPLEAQNWPIRSVIVAVVERAIEFIDVLDDNALQSTSTLRIAQWQKLRKNLQPLCRYYQHLQVNDGLI